MELIMIIIQALYFFLPAYIANMIPVFAAKILGKRFDTPVDFGKTLNGKPLFGSHKTWRGLITGIIGGILIAWLQQYLYSTNLFFEELSILDYSVVNIVAFGFLLSFGALAGDMVKSFFKRRMNIKPGKPWIPFDQLDFVIGGLLVTAIIFIPSFWIILTLLIISPILHILTNNIGYLIKVKDTKW